MPQGSPRQAGIWTILFTIILAACGIQWTECTVDGKCSQFIVSNEGIQYTDPETGVLTKGPTVDQLGTSSEYRFQLSIDTTLTGQIPRSDAFNYLNRAVESAARNYRLCGYSDDGLVILGLSHHIPYNEIHVAPARGTVNGEDNFIVFAKYSPGTALIFQQLSCVAYRRVQDTSAQTSGIEQEMQGVTEALISIGARLET